MSVADETWVDTHDGGTIRGRSGRLYRVAGGRGACESCGQEFGATFVLDPGEPLPRLGYLHHADGMHQLTMTGDSEAARSLREGAVIAQTGGLVN